MVAEFYHKCIVIDNSVLLKGFFLEEYSPIVYDLIAMNLKRDTTFFAPSILIYEFFNVISREYSSFDGVGYAFDKFKALNISLIEPDDEVLMQASKALFDDPSISYYDAVYHALAKNMDATFLTADKKYYNSLKKKENVEYLGNLKVR